MTRARLQAHLSVVYVLLLLLLLAVLAVLQYRWTGEASLAEQQRMQAGLREALSFLEAGFDDEISRLLLAFWPDPSTAGPATLERQSSQLSESLTGALERWHATASHPEMLRDLLVAEAGDDAPPRLFRLDRGARTWVPASWPAELGGFRDLLERHARGVLSTEEQRRWSPLDGRFLFPYCAVAGAPAFVSPLLILPAKPDAIRTHGMQVRHPYAQVRLCLILHLDREYITRQWLPSLATRYLSVEGESQYDYLVVLRDHPEQVICRSDSGNPPSLLSAPDAEVSLLRLRTGERMPPSTTRPMAREQARRPPSNAGRGVPGGGGPFVETRRNATTGETAGVERRPRDEMRGVMEALTASGWRLLVKHRAGSVEAAVTQLRRRNLYVSFGILLILASSLIVLATAVRRARKLAQQQLEFVASISHELRTPVTAVCSLSENLADGLVQPPDQIKRYGQLLLREGRRLGTLVEQALEFAGIASGRRSYRLQPLSVQSLVHEALQSCEAQLRERNARVETQVEPDLPMIAGEAESIGCAVRNLVSNSVKYSPGTAEITVRARRGQEPDQVEIEVADRGMGIEPDEKKRLFEPFFRGRNALRSQIRGAGIGLSLVKSIVQAHKGTVRVASRSGKGTVVTLSFPALKPDSPEDSA